MEKQVFITRELQNYSSVTQAIQQSGFNFSYKILEQKVIEANKIISNKLSIPIASKVFSFKKLRIVEGKPRTIEHIYIDYNKVKGIENADLSNTSLYYYLKENYNIEVKKDSEEIFIVRSTEEESQLLNIDKNSEVILVSGTSYLDNDIPLEYFELIALYDFFRFRSVSKYESE